MPRKGVQVNTDTRRVYLFIAVGLMAAGVVGYGVWRAGTPTTPSASDTATVTPEVSTIPESAHAALITPMSEPPSTSVEAAPQPLVPPRLDDPFLAPHAIVQAVPSTIAPTTVYRPENIRPVAPLAGAPAEPGEPVTPPGDATDVTESTETPESTQPTVPTVPTEPTEPTDTPATPGTTLPTPSPEQTPATDSAFVSEASTPRPTSPEPTAADTPAAPASVEESPAPQDPAIEQAAVVGQQPSHTAQHVSAGQAPAGSS